MQVKRTLDQEIFEAGAEFLYQAQPAAPWLGSGGHLRGVIYATRAGLIAIQASRIVDATPGGEVGRMLGWKNYLPLQGSLKILHTTLCEGDGADADCGGNLERLQDIEGRIGDTPYRLSARQYSFVVDFDDGSPRAQARASMEIIGRCHVPATFRHQEGIRIASMDTSAVAKLHAEHLPAERNLLGLSAALVSDAQARAALYDPVLAVGFVEAQSGRLSGLREALPPPDAEPPPTLEQLDLPHLERCDVLVIGGGTAGAPAAIASGRTGADTILIESTHMLGGVGTAGQIASYWCGNRVGFTSEIDAGVNELEFDPEMRQRDSKWSIAAKAEWFRRECVAAGVTLFHQAVVCGSKTHAGKVQAALVAMPGWCGWITAGTFVDATGSADLAAAAGAEVSLVNGSHVAVQGTGLAGVQPGHDYHNSDHSFSDETDARDATSFFFSSRIKFADHFDLGTLIDSRERRKIVGDIELGPLDFLAERRYPDTICVASSNFDSHGFTIHPIFMCKPPDKKRLWADVPFRALLPRGLERIIVTGLGISAHRDALPVVRMQPDVQNQGYAAGLIAATSALKNCDLRALDLRSLQRELVHIGNLPERVLADTDSFPLPDDAFQAAVAQGLDTFKGLAIVFSDPARSKPLLRSVLEAENSDTRWRHQSALILGLSGDPVAEPLLRKSLEQRPWDIGWNFRGMHQFGMSLSELDVLLIALGRCGSASAWDCLVEKASALALRSPPQAELTTPDPLPEFSHCRALAEAFEALYPRFHDSRAAKVLMKLLRLPGMTGHAHRHLQEALRDLTPDPTENAIRNRSLRELHLARALFRCGDPDGTGRNLLEGYAADLRSAYARHARAVLAGQT